jgi:hypothetical protein
MVSNEWCDDEVHKLKGPVDHYTVGGPLYLVKTSQSCPKLFEGQIVYNQSSASKYVFDGRLYPRFVAAAPSFSLIPKESESDISIYGPEAWAKFRPGRPKANLATFIGEARDLPRLLQFRLKAFRDLGSNYLNVQFGWIPFLNDIREMVKLSKTIELELDKIRKNNGKWFLREGSVKEEKYTTATWSGKGSSLWFGFTPSVHDGFVQFPTIEASGSASYERKVWFSGRFGYYIPVKELNSVRWRRNTIRKLYGLSLTPDVLWELMPWSWLIDYFTNAGEIFKNLSTGYVDAVAKYAYLMGTTRFAQEQQSSFKSSDGQLITGVIQRERSYKVRIGASPFGFGLTSDNLTVGQQMILAALGLSRSRF